MFFTGLLVVRLGSALGIYRLVLLGRKDLLAFPVTFAGQVAQCKLCQT